MQTGDIVRFRTNTLSKAGQTCHRYQITGVIRECDHLGTLQVDAGFGYPIFARTEELDVVITREYVPMPGKSE